MDPLQAAIRDISKEDRSFHPDQRTLSALNVLNDRHHCQRCGKCCTGQVVGMLGVEAVAIARHLQLAPSEFKRCFIERRVGKWLLLRRRDDDTCPFLFRTDGTGAAYCQIYPVRPETCRRFPWLTPMVMTGSKWPIMVVSDEICPLMSRTFAGRSNHPNEASGAPVPAEYDSVGGGTD